MSAEAPPARSAPRRRVRVFLWMLIAAAAAWHLMDLREAVQVGTIPLYDFIEYWAAGRVFARGGNPYSAPELLAVHRDEARVADPGERQLRRAAGAEARIQRA